MYLPSTSLLHLPAAGPELRGRSIYLRNAGPEGPFTSPAAEADPDFPVAPEYTAQVGCGSATC
jgi:hypothetical protein